MAYKIDLYSTVNTPDYSYRNLKVNDLFLKSFTAIKHPRFKGGQVIVTLNTKIKNNANYFKIDGVGYFIIDVNHINDNTTEITGDYDVWQSGFYLKTISSFENDFVNLSKDNYYRNRIKINTKTTVKYSRNLGTVNYYGIDYFGNSVSENSHPTAWKDSYSMSIFKDGIYPKNQQVTDGIKAKGIINKPFGGYMEFGQPVAYWLADVEIPYSLDDTEQVVVGLDGELRTLSGNGINSQRKWLAINKGDSVRNTKVYLIASNFDFSNQAVLAEWEFRNTYYAFNYSKLDVRYKEKYGMDNMDVVKVMSDLATTVGVGALTGFGATGMGSIFSAIGDSVFAIINRNVFYKDLGSSFYIETGKNSAGSTLRNGMVFSVINVDGVYSIPKLIDGYQIVDSIHSNRLKGFIKGNISFSAGSGTFSGNFNQEKLVSAFRAGVYIDN